MLNGMVLLAGMHVCVSKGMQKSGFSKFCVSLCSWFVMRRNAGLVGRSGVKEFGECV
jgi:hypothetical protein